MTTRHAYDLIRGVGTHTEPGGTGAAVLSARDRELFELRAAGWTLARIGERFGISRQRVDQILRGRGGPSATETAVQRLREARRAPRAKYSDCDLVRGLREVAGVVGHTPSISEYEPVARELGIAHTQTIILRFGSWTGAATAAGLRPNPATGAAYRKTWDASACWAALESVADKLGCPPCLQTYEELAAGRPDLPSGSTIYQRLGRWTGVALELIARTGRRGDSAPD